ncbi:uncharacterized protein LOC117320851 [Pecten maximus]|uniref:uncharacterized protein LOC117320851 n=1 Tax=Pecten maximus TaxID=6579 RepID=UPI001458255A|nr:uncharacterized protein LOC117320851 [Pecten maximus]
MQEAIGIISEVDSSNGVKLETKISHRVKVAVTRFRQGNGELYVHLAKGWDTTFSLHYSEFEELCLAKEAFDSKLHLLDDLSNVDTQAAGGSPQEKATVPPTTVPPKISPSIPSTSGSTTSTILANL